MRGCTFTLNFVLFVASELCFFPVGFRRVRLITMMRFVIDNVQAILAPPGTNESLEADKYPANNFILRLGILSAEDLPCQPGCPHLRARQKLMVVNDLDVGEQKIL